MSVSILALRLRPGNLFHPLQLINTGFELLLRNLQRALQNMRWTMEADRRENHIPLHQKEFAGTVRTGS
ncbi:hypothetical protein [Noviherbaspirillum aerium]|uniref:hypothetical protein n=1 Tax=Noviherbaspirillum aerium TaxID=2588497 RepID=UPI00124CEA27|nr:hypothetical protein [Noviherbaspirillum aerium]